MKVIAAGKAKNGFGLLIDTARAEPVMIEKHGRPVWSRRSPVPPSGLVTLRYRKESVVGRRS